MTWVSRVWRPVVAALFVVVICLTAATALRIQVASYTPIPFADGWFAVDIAHRAFTSGIGLGDLAAQHNEHRILVGRLQFLAEYGLFGGRLVFLLGMVFASCVLLAALMTWPFAAVWRDRTVTLGFFAFALSATLTPAGWENLTWAFQVCFVEVYLFVVVAIALAVLGLGPVDTSGNRLRRAIVVGGIVLSAAAATYSLANGLVVWPILVAVLLLRRMGRGPVLAVAVAGAVSTASYLWGYRTVAAHSSYTTSLEHPLTLMRYVATFLGQPGHPLGSVAVYALGTVGAAAALALVVVAVRERARPGGEATLFGAAVSLFVLVTAGQTALGRESFGVAQALASRYSIAAAVFWTGLVVGVAPLLARSRPVTLRARGRSADVTGLALVTACLAISFSLGRSAAPARDLEHAIQTVNEPIVVALAAGVRDDDAFRANYGVLPWLEWLRAERLGPWSTGAGEALVAAERRVGRARRLRRCGGYVDTVRPVVGGERLDGWIVAPPGRTPAPELDVVDVAGASDGVGLVGFYRPDVKAARASTSDTRGYVAYARTKPGAAAQAAELVLFDSATGAALCALPLEPA